MAEGMVQLTTIGHLKRQLQPLVAEVEGGASAIEVPAPAPAAMFVSPLGAAQADHARAADQHNPRTIRECASEGGAFIAGGGYAV